MRQSNRCIRITAATVSDETEDRRTCHVSSKDWKVGKRGDDGAVYHPLASAWALLWILTPAISWNGQVVSDLGLGPLFTQDDADKGMVLDMTETRGRDHRVPRLSSDVG